MYKWTLDTAVQFVMELEIALAPNYHVALAGSTLHKGFSANDLDVVIIPHSSDRNRHSEVKELLEAFGMTRKVTCSRVHEKWARKGSTDTKFVEVWDNGGLKVDVFQLSPETGRFFEGSLEEAKAGHTPCEKTVPETANECMYLQRLLQAT